MVLRHEGDTVNFLGLEITKTSKGFEVKNSTDLGEPHLNLCGWKNRNRGDHNTVEVVLRTIISVNQLSIYGAVADMCDELACSVTD